MAVQAVPRKVTQAEAEAFAQRWLPAIHDLWAGKPGRMIQAFLVIDDKHSAMVVRFELNGNQLFIHQEVFEPLKHWTDGLEVVLLKDRQATATSFLQAVAFVFVLSLPNIFVVHVFQDKDTGEQLGKRLDLFWNNLHPMLLAHDGVSVVKKGDSKSELELEFWESGQHIGTSRYLIISAGAREFGAAIPPNFIIYDEYDLYPNLELVARINAAKGANCKTFKLSTPRGMKQLHEDYFAAKEGRSGAQALVLYCFQNGANRMEQGHRLAPPAYRDGFALLPEHLRVMESEEWVGRSIHKGDPKAFFRWWEWKRQEIRQVLAAQGISDEDRVLGEMEADHCTNDRDCWLNMGKSPFSREVLRDYGQRSRLPNTVKRTEPIAQNVTLTVFEEPQIGMAYACGMDCAEGGGLGDDAVAFVKSAAGQYVATVKGTGRFDLTQMSKALVYVLWRYGKDEWEPLLAPEVDGGLGHAVVMVAREMGYRNIWKVPPKPGEDMDRYQIIKAEKYGWKTQNNKEDMKQIGAARFNNRDALILDQEFLRHAANFDPETVKHTPDMLMAFFITECITFSSHTKNFGRQFASMAARVRVLHAGAPVQPRPLQSLGWGRQPARPFIMR